MPNVEIVGVEFGSYNIRLKNSDLVIAGGRAYMVSSYISDDRHAKNSAYCSFVDLETGSKAFPEPSSRNTTLQRIHSHLCKTNSHKYGLKQSDIHIVSSDSYSLQINIDGGKLK